MVLGLNTSVDSYGAHFEVRTEACRFRRLRTVIQHGDEVVVVIETAYTACADRAELERLLAGQHWRHVAQLHTGRLHLKTVDAPGRSRRSNRLGRAARACLDYLLDVQWHFAVPVRSKRVTVLAWLFAVSSLTATGLSVQTERGLLVAGPTFSPATLRPAKPRAAGTTLPAATQDLPPPEAPAPSGDQTGSPGDPAPSCHGCPVRTSSPSLP